MNQETPASAPVSDAVRQALAVTERGCEELIPQADWLRKLVRSEQTGQPLRIKLGLDPTAPDIHLGHTVVLNKLRQLQDLGHQVIFLIGDFTSLIGDPSGRNATRPPLTPEQIKANAQTYYRQASLVLDPSKTEIRYNSEWSLPLGAMGMIQLASRYTVARMMERNDFHDRFKAGNPISVHEFLYPLMQGWDSVMVRSDLELGGTDQLFNLLRGRDLQREEGQRGQICFTTPLIDGLDGRKMSKSYGNAVSFNDEPEDMHGKVMSIEDGVMKQWYALLTDLPDAEAEAVLAGHPREAKARLAQEITCSYHGLEAALKARDAFDRRFRDKEVPEEVPELAWPSSAPAEGVALMSLLKELGLCASTSEAKRLVEGGGVRLDGEVQSDPRRTLARPAESMLVQVGKRKFARVR